MITTIMHSKILKLRPDDTLSKALDVMGEHKVNGAPVIDIKGKLVGMIVKADIYRFLMEEGHYDTCPVEWVMTKDVITAHEDEDVIDVAKRIRKNNIIAIPVIDDDNTVEGMISIGDIVDYFIDKSDKN
ncbi:CBS domain-containing protein [Clostridium sp. cel8]|jgi:CBS domain-containing protein|uniref:CBS domain-containing protein n=1 Tax=unclassified Clostridium TaxID=2614128 RepID=UPI0015F6A390|nr:CBS domain-containing protein [Clostridium sp. cel8]MBA5851848.1 CBS domain-containing protein [Clostridium sp. cel8]